LFTDLAIAHGDGRYARLLRTISRAKLLILDDRGPETLTQIKHAISSKSSRIATMPALL
jgi:DNA replication protein DnaC